jgi:hypothetical protein
MKGAKIPPCRHRGDEFAPGKWTCSSPKVIAPARIVTADVCSTICPYVDHPLAPASRAAGGIAAIRVRPRPRRLAIGMVTAPRHVRTVEQSLAELRRAGFRQTIHLFEEPRTRVARRRGVAIKTHRRRMGLWRNWRYAARWMLAHTTAPFILLCEDDIRLTPSSGLALAHAIEVLPHETWGYASLYTPLHNVMTVLVTNGWQAIDHDMACWGSLAYCFTRESLACVLASPIVRQYRGDRDTDTLVTTSLAAAGRRRYFHVPSLCEHTGGGISCLGHVQFAEMAAVGYSPDYRGYLAARRR